MHKLILNIVILLLCSYGVLYAGEVEEIYKKEIFEIQSSSIHKHEQVFFIRIFDDAFPIPSRYELTSYSNASDKVRFTSPLFIKNNPEYSLKQAAIFSGTIEVGKYSNEIDPINNISKSSLLHVGSNTVNGLKIDSFVLKDSYSPNSGHPKMVFIHDGKEYIRITDSNPGLWRALMDLFNKINN